jgi:hypothetical protein
VAELNGYSHLRNPPLVNSTWKVTSKRELPSPAEVMQALVFTENDVPIGTSGVCVVVKTVTALLKSQARHCSSRWHLVVLGPGKQRILGNGFIYLSERAKSYLWPFQGI